MTLISVNHQRRMIQAIYFELGALVLLVAILFPLFNYNLLELGVMGAVFSLLTMVILYFYNLLFDQVLLHQTGSMRKSTKARVVHALLFEASLLVLFLPLIMWWLDIDVLDALKIEVVAATFMVIYTFVFHWLVERYLFRPEV